MKMPLTPEKFAEIIRRVEARKALMKPLPKTKVVVSDARNVEGRPEIVRDADVIVSRGDVNALRRGSEVVEVRREPEAWLSSPRVTINYPLAEYQQAQRRNAEDASRWDREASRAADPMNLWGTTRSDD
jgi:hypothetical protein